MTDITQRLRAAIAKRYRVERELGAGGMATVYLAQDIKHDRKVALKVLRPELAAVIGAERFLNEILVTANLQHPHILALHDSGEADGYLYYVMPFIEGESLRDRLEREKEMSVEDSVNVASQVAYALDYAHRHNVVHRDIKPENILLHDGQALVADFGISLAVTAAAGDRLTETGLSLGTPQYMSPEQATADRALDARSDIYSLGCVAYEMLVGEPPYTGPSAQAIIARIVTEEPRPITQRRRTVPPHVDAAVGRALEKLPADRFGTATEFANALLKPGATWIAEAPAGATPVPGGLTAPPVPAKSWTRFVWPVVAIAATAVAGWLYLEPVSTATAPTVARFMVDLPSHEQIAEAPGRMIAAAPDGSGFVYVGVGPNGRRLYFRAFNSFEARTIPGTEDGAHPFFSPDGSWVGFQADDVMKKVPLAGGPTVTLTAGTYSGASWGPDDVIIFSPSDEGGLRSVPATGGQAEEVTSVDPAIGERDHRWPEILPNGKAVLFVTSIEGTPQIGVLSLETDSVKYLVEGTFPRYAGDGHLVFAAANGIRAAPFDPDLLELTGPAVPVDADVGATRSAVNDFDISRNGSLVYLTGNDSYRSLVTVDRQGRETVLTPELRGYDGPRFSPDGIRLAMRINDDGDFHIWSFDIEGGGFTRLTFAGANYYPEWTPDGARVTFISWRDESADPTTGRPPNPDVYWKPADGSGAAETLLAADGSQWEVDWMDDGNGLIFRQNDPETGRDLWLMSLADDSATVEPLLQTSDQERSARVDGRELFYRQADGLVAVSIQTDPVFSPGASEVLFKGPYVPNPMHTNYDIHPDGDRFVMVRSAEGERQVAVILNWMVELEGITGH
jgi:serine/threonine-protein kinase